MSVVKVDIIKCILNIMCDDFIPWIILNGFVLGLTFAFWDFWSAQNCCPQGLSDVNSLSKSLKSWSASINGVYYEKDMEEDQL